MLFQHMDFRDFGEMRKFISASLRWLQVIVNNSRALNGKSALE
jgi:hypothetical protein